MYLMHLALLVLTLVVPLGRACPRSCNCYQANEVHCTFRSLISVPPGLPAHTRRINLGFNSISNIPDNSLAGLRRVELLMLHGNNLQQIPNGVFRDMKSLQILKLSYNKLREISSSLTFAGLTSLLRLYLDHNLLQHIHPRALLQLPSLKLLRLQGNRLHQLHPHSLCTLSLLNTYFFSTLRNLDLSNNSLTTLPREILETAPLLETLVMQANPWSCDCRMKWFLSWSLAHPGLMKCPGGPQCPVCSSPTSRQGQGLLEKIDLLCTSPVILSSEREKPLEVELSEIQTIQAFRKPLGNASLSLSDDQGHSVDLRCNISHSTNSQDIFPAPDLSLSSASPLSLTLSLSLDCPAEGGSYEKLWRILAYYSETAVHLEREIMLSKAPALAFRYKQAAEKEGFYHTGVRASIKAWPHWLLQPAISIQLNRAQSSRDQVHLILSTRVSAHPDPTSHLPAVSHPWLLILTNHTFTATAAIAGSKVELSCPVLSSGNPFVQWILPDRSQLISPSSNPDRRVRASGSGLILEKLELSDAGLYYCVASAGRDVDVLALRLIVDEPSVPPRAEQRGLPVTGMVGEPISLSCKASGAPEPYISWLLPDGNLVRQGLALSVGLTLQENGSLFLPHPSLKDAGPYRCIAVNQYGADSLSMQLELNSQLAPPLRTSLSRGPQSAAGRSTRIRAPLLHQPTEEEGSGDGKEVEGSPVANRNHSRPLQPMQNRRYPTGKPRRRGPVRIGPLRRGGVPSSTTEQRGIRFDSRHRITTNKQRLDPKKWADLLFKIRQKTALHNNSQIVTAATPTADTLESGEDSGRHEEENDTDKSPAEGAAVEVESEGSSIDDTALHEDGLQSVPHVHVEAQTHRETNADEETDIERSTETQTDMENESERHMQTDKVTETGAQTHRETKTDEETDTDVERGMERSTETPTDKKNEAERHMQTDKVTETGPQTVIVTEPQTHRETKTDKETDTDVERGMERSTETLTDMENEAGRHMQTDKVTETGPQTVIATQPQTHRETKTDKKTDTDVERGMERSTETPTDKKNEAERHMQTDKVTETGPQTHRETKTDKETDTDVERGMERSTETLTDMENESERHMQTDKVTETGAQTHRETKTDKETDTDVERDIERSTETLTDMENEAERHMQTDKVTETGPQTVIATQPQTHRETKTDEETDTDVERDIGRSTETLTDKKNEAERHMQTDKVTETGPQTVIATQPQTHRETKTDEETDTDVERDIGRSTETLTDKKNEAERHMQTDKVTETGPQTVIVTEPQTHRETKTDKETDTDVERGIERSTKTQTDIKNEAERHMQTDKVTETGAQTHRETKTDKETDTDVERGMERSTETLTDMENESERHMQTDKVTETGAQTHRETKTDKETDTDVERGIERSTKTQTDIKNEAERHMQTDKVTETGPQTVIVKETQTQSDLVTAKPIPGTNEIVAETKQQGNRGTSRTRPQNSRPGLVPNLVPNSRPQSPWNTRRRIGQRRRIINRPRGRPVTPPQSLPDPTNSRPQIRTSDTTTNQMNSTLSMASTSTTSTTLFTGNDYIESTPGMGLNSPPPPLLNTFAASSSKPLSYTLTPSLDAAPSPSSLSPSHKKTHIDVTTPSALTRDSVSFGLSNAPTLTFTHSGIALAKTHGPSIWTYTRTRTRGKHVDSTSSKKSEELQRNLPYSSSHLSIVPSTVPSTSTAATAKIATSVFPRSTSSNGISTSTSTTTTTKDIFPITSTRATISPFTASPAMAVNPIFAITRTTTIPTFTSTPSSPIHPIPTTIPNTAASTTTSAIPTSDSTTTTTSPPRTTISWVFGLIPNTTANAVTRTTSTTSARASSKDRPSLGFDSRGKSISVVPNQSHPSTDWRNSGANSIPDSHHRRPQWPPSLPLPGSPGVLRSRPRIADPHIRTVSVPADTTARLACEAVGEPKPSIIWTKVSTGTAISAHSRTQRFEVLPNGTLVIQNVQLQDRGTYICSANSFLGRDRMLTTLEVWTRPPRMKLLSYREATIHLGGELYLECQADGIPPPLLSWVLPDRSVLTSGSPSHGRITMDTNGTLHISATLPSDRGLYRCVASNSAGAASASVRVHVSSLPPVIQQLREVRLVLSPAMPLYAHCSARGAPPPTVRWRIPDGTLLRTSQFVHGNLFVLPNGTLHIQRVGLKDSGSYECTATNAVGADKRIVRVEVQTAGAVSAEGARNNGARPSPTSSLRKDVTSPHNYPSEQLNPYSTRLSPPSSFDRSRTFLLNPSSPRSSDPHPPYSTSSPTKINKAVTHFNRTNVASPPSSVPTNTKFSPSFVNNTRVVPPSPADKNRATTVLHSLPISPFSKARIVSTSPSITTVHYGRILQLHCSVTGNPSPTIIWRTPSRKLVDTHFSFDQRLKVHPNGTLTVQAVTEKDAGDYLCVARNKVADDYRLLRVSVATKPAKIEPKQPFNQMVSFGGPLKVDCQASGLPDPAVHWSLPDGTMVNSVLHGEERGGRARRLTVFGNGTLLVPAVGMGEEGEYTCYAENQGGQDTMKVKVKVMMTFPPTFNDDSIFHVIKVRQGMTAAVRCRAVGDPTPMVTWSSPVNRVIPQGSGSGYFAQRVQTLSDGTLEVRFAQTSDAGNYTCRARNSVGQRIRVVGLEVEVPHHGLSGQLDQSGIAVKEGRGWIKSSGPGNGHSSSRSGDIINSPGLSRSSPIYGLSNGFRSKLSGNNSSSSAYSENNGSIRNTVQSTGSNIASTGFHPAHRSRNGVHGPVGGVTAQLDSRVIVIMSETTNPGIKAENTGINAPAVLSSSSNREGNNHKQFGGIPGSVNEVTRGTTNTDPSTSKLNGRLSATLRNNDVFSGSASINGSAAGILRGNGFSGSSNRRLITIGSGVNDDNSGKGVTTGSNSEGTGVSGLGNSTNTAVNVASTVQQRVVKGQTVLLPCPSQGYPPPRLSWLLPGNGVLPAPYYGSRLTVYRNGSLELRGVRSSDRGTLVCVVRGEGGESRIQVELVVSETQDNVGLSNRAPVAERPVQKSPVLLSIPDTGTSVDSTQLLSSWPALPKKPQSRIPVTEKPPQRALTVLAAPPIQSSVPVSEPVVTTRTASLVTIINGETLHLPCPAPQPPGSSQGLLTWTLPSGKVLSRGESADLGQYFVQPDGMLRVQKASVYDRGTYSCRSTSYNTSSVYVGTVPVIVIAYPPRITTGPSPVTYTRPGVAVELPCLAIATPRATITWETPDLSQLKVINQARIYGNRHLSAQGSLVIQNPTSRDTGFYRCTAKNVIGTDTKVTYLHVI